MADKLNFLNFTCLDFETSGLDPNNDQIIEACVIRVRDGEPVSVFNTLVQLREGTELAPKITEVTGYTKDDLTGGISEEQLAVILGGLILDDELLVAYNALFDLSFLEALHRKTEVMYSPDYMIPNNFIDPLTISRNRQPYPHKLGDTCKRLGIPLEGAHSAYDDTFALLDVVLAMHKEKDISEWVNVAGYRPKYGEPSWYPPHATLKKQGSEIVKHSKPNRAGQPLVVPKVTTTTNQRKKAVPDDPKEFAKLLPKALIDVQLMRKISMYMDDPFCNHFEFMCTEDEVEGVYSYLTEIKNIPEKQIDSDHDGDVWIYVTKGYAIDITDDDLPF